MLSHLSMSVTWCMDQVWQEWITPYTTVWPSYTPQICSASTLVFITMSLNRIPHQWCSGPRMMIDVWYVISLFFKCYVRYVPYLEGVGHPIDHCITSNYTPAMISCYTDCGIQKLEPWTSSIAVVVQWWWWRYGYGYATSLIYESYIRHGSYLTGVDRHTDHSMTSINTPVMISCYPGVPNNELKLCSLLLL